MADAHDFDGHLTPCQRHVGFVHIAKRALSELLSPCPWASSMLAEYPHEVLLLGYLLLHRHALPPNEIKQIGNSGRRTVLVDRVEVLELLFLGDRLEDRKEA